MIERQELVEVAVGPSGGDALKGLGEPGGWIDTVHLGGLEKRGDGRPCSSAAVGTGEEGILAGDGLWPDCALDSVAIDVEATLVQEAFEGLATASGIADGLGEFRFAGDAAQLLLPERPELCDDGSRLLLARGSAGFGILAADFFLDRPQPSHPLDGLARHLRDAG